MTVNEFRENYPDHQLQTTLRHYKPQETVKVNWFKTVTHPAECIMEAKIISDKGLTIATGTSYNNNEKAGVNFLDIAETFAIGNAFDNLKELV